MVLFLFMKKDIDRVCLVFLSKRVDLEVFFLVSVLYLQVFLMLWLDEI